MLGTALHFSIISVGLIRFISTYLTYIVLFYLTVCSQCFFSCLTMEYWQSVCVFTFVATLKRRRFSSGYTYALLGFLSPLFCRCCIRGSFVVHFRTDQSNFDWGFKLTSLACVDAPGGLDHDNDAVS